jgi:uncharacterized membrane protein YhaH (DUF805 family)
MGSLTNIFSVSGRLAPNPFAQGALAVYVAGFLSQFLLASPITSRAHIVPFVLVQIALVWIWYALHARRLRDAGRGVGGALVLTVLYVLAIATLLAVVLAGHGGKLPADSSGFAFMSVVAVLVFALATTAIVGTSSALGMFGPVLLVSLIALTLPVLVGFVFTIWLASRPSVPVPASPPP